MNHFSHAEEYTETINTLIRFRRLRHAADALVARHYAVIQRAAMLDKLEGLVAVLEATVPRHHQRQQQQQQESQSVTNNTNSHSDRVGCRGAGGSLAGRMSSSSQQSATVGGTLGQRARFPTAAVGGGGAFDLPPSTRGGLKPPFGSTAAPTTGNVFGLTSTRTGITTTTTAAAAASTSSSSVYGLRQRAPLGATGTGIHSGTNSSNRNSHSGQSARESKAKPEDKDDETSSTGIVSTPTSSPVSGPIPDTTAPAVPPLYNVYDLDLIAQRCPLLRPLNASAAAVHSVARAPRDAGLASLNKEFGESLRQQLERHAHRFEAIKRHLAEGEAQEAA